MTRNSKRSARRFFDSIDRRCIKASWVMCCTLPASFACTALEFKAILARYFAALTRAWGDSAAWYWVVEVTEAQQWHIHMIWMWVKNPQTSKEKWEKFRDWNDKIWHRSTGVTDPRHQRVACQIKPTGHFEKAVNYLIGQYFVPAKWAHYTGGSTGRVHGVRNAVLLEPVVAETPVTPGAAALLRRVAAKLKRRRASRTFWLEVSTGKRNPVDRGVDSTRERATIKWLASLGMGREQTVRLKRVKPRQFMNCVEWEDEFELLPDGREKHLGVAPARVFSPAQCELKPYSWVLNRLAGRWEKKWHSPGDPAPSYAFGPSELRIPWEQGQKLLAWAIKEDRRRSSVDGDLPF